MKQLKVSLDTDLRGHIERAANAAGRSLGEEIRNRLRASVADDQKRTKKEQLCKLLDEIEQIAADVEYQCNGAKWDTDPKANGMFSAAVHHQIISYDLSSPWHSAGALIAALLQPEADASGRVIAKEVRRRTESKIFGLGTRSLIRPVGEGDDQNGLPDEAAQIFERAASDAAAELRRAGARPRRTKISGEGTPQGKVAKDDPGKEGIAEGRSTKRKGKRR